MAFLRLQSDMAVSSRARHSTDYMLKFQSLATAADPGISAMHSISTSAPIGRAATPIHVLAGIISGLKN